MSDEKAPPQAKKLVKFIDKPFGGLFGSTCQQKVLEELYADPHSTHRIADLARITDIHRRTVRKALVALEEFLFVTVDLGEKKHSDFKVNLESKILIGLEILSHSISDALEGTSVMEEVIADYAAQFKQQLESEVFSGVNLENYVLSNQGDVRPTVYLTQYENTNPNIASMV